MPFRVGRDEAEEKHWWYVGRRAVLAALAPKLSPGPSLEVGCGYHSGLPPDSPNSRLVGLDMEHDKLTGFRLRHGAQVVQGNAEQLPFPEGTFASCLLLDVLEHVRDDWLALSEAFRVLSPGGRALVTVPAFPSLWSAHDEADMHLRRYRRRELLRLCEGAGFRIVKGAHFNILFFPAALLWRIVSRRLYRHRIPGDDFFMFPRPINAFFAALFSFERFVVPYLPLPFGLSIFAILEKPRG